MDDRIAYVVVDWGTPQLATECEESIIRNRPESFRVVVDAKVLEAGYARALNIGIAQCPETEIVCCLNADTEMLWNDDRILELFDENPELAIIGPRQRNAAGEIVHGGIVPYMDGGTEWDLELRHRCWMGDLGDPDVELLTRVTMDVPTVAGSVLYIRRTVLEGLGGWPTFSDFYFEDTALAYLARHRGHRVAYTGEVTWKHYLAGSPVGVEWRAERMVGSSRRFVRWCRHHGIPIRVEHYLQEDYA